MRLYYLIGRLSSPFQLAFFAIYNKVFHVPRARVLVWNEHKELLLVRSWGGKPQWGLPGGGVMRNEQYVDAARRELYEEVGLGLAVEAFTYVATLHYQYVAPIFSVTVLKDALPAAPHNPREITDLRWFSVDGLPTDLSPLVLLALKNLSKTD